MVPDKSQFARDFLGPKLRIVGDVEDTRRHSFDCLNLGCVELRKTDLRWGLLEKTGGAQVRNRAADIWLYDLGDGTAQVVDVIGNAEGEGNPREAPVPSWAVKDIRPISQWKEPYGDVVTPPDTPDPPSGDVEARLAALEAQMALLVPAVEKAGNVASGAYLRAENAVDLAGVCGERIDRLKATGPIDLPVVVDFWNRKARAKGDVALKVTD